LKLLRYKELQGKEGQLIDQCQTETTGLIKKKKKRSERSPEESKRQSGKKSTHNRATKKTQNHDGLEATLLLIPG